jgi:serine/arginine repetitive matrix protein 2
MYNGVGLQTARGSGTSGFVQRNLSHLLPGQKPKLSDYGTELKQRLKENPLLPPKEPNAEILEHERKRKIEA